MNKEKIYELFDISNTCKVDVRIPFNQLYKASELTTKEAKEFSKDIEKILLIAEISSSNSRYQSFINTDYRIEAIQFLMVYLNRYENVEWIDNVLHKVFPNPIVIIYLWDDKYALSTSLKRLNKVEKNKIVVEEINNTGFSSKEHFEMAINKSNTISNLYALYKNIDDLLCFEKLFLLTNKYNYSITLEEIKKLYKEIEQAKKENHQLQIEYEKEKNSSKKMKLFMHIRQNEEEIKNKLKRIEE